MHAKPAKASALALAATQRARERTADGTSATGKVLHPRGLRSVPNADARAGAALGEAGRPFQAPALGLLSGIV
jgi:hypothetical protein